MRVCKCTHHWLASANSDYFFFSVCRGLCSICKSLKLVSYHRTALTGRSWQMWTYWGEGKCWPILQPRSRQHYLLILHSLHNNQSLAVCYFHLTSGWDSLLFLLGFPLFLAILGVFQPSLFCSARFPDSLHQIGPTGILRGNTFNGGCRCAIAFILICTGPKQDILMWEHSSVPQL